MKKINILAPIIFLSALLPVVAFAQITGSLCDGVSGIGNLICRFQELLNSLIPVLVLLGIVYFVWGVITYMIAGGEEAKTKGRDRIIYGLIGFAVIFSLSGLTSIIIKTFGFEGQGVGAPALINTTTAAASGSACEVGTTFQGLMGYATCIINNSVIPLIFALAIAMFIWGAVKFFIINADEEAKREQGKQFMIWGVIALAVMMSVWGLVAIFRSTFDKSGRSVLPQACPPGSSQCNGGTTE